MRERGNSISEWISSTTGLKTGKVLDLGCGPGFFSIPLASADYDVVGIDYSYEMVARATENASRTGVQPVFMRMDAQSMTFADESFDLIVSRDVLWNLEYPEKAYSEILRVLKHANRSLWRCPQDTNLHPRKNSFWLDFSPCVGLMAFFRPFIRGKPSVAIFMPSLCYFFLFKFPLLLRFRFAV